MSLPPPSPIHPARHSLIVFPSCKPATMACNVHNHHTTSRFLALLLALLAETLLAHRSNALWPNTSSSTPGVGGGSSSLQAPACHCRPEHAAALLQLKQSFTFTASSNGCPNISANTTLSSWNEGTDCCRWEGVACDHVAGSVTGLDLSSRSQSLGINGSGLHPALFSLTSLEHLVLDGSHFCGSHLPASGFERLTRLEGLSLRYCNISGPIPSSFAGLHSLTTIHLSYNNFNGSSTFPLWITHLKQLKVLDFQGMGLSGTIPSSIGNLSLLTELSLSGNYFSGGLPSSLSNLTYLSRLECTKSGLSGRVPSLKNLSRLEFIDLSNNNLEGNIPLSEGNMLRNLQSVHMRSNSFTGQIQASMFSQPALQYLDLRDNHLSGHIEEIQNPSTTLKAILLSNNNLSGEIPTSFSQLRALTVLELDSNNFMGMLDLYPYLMLRNLSSIRASNNPVLSVSAEDRGDSTNGSIIDTLELASCGLTRVPSVLKYLPKLDHLDLSNNGIHGNIPNWIWRNMSALYLQHNLFTKVGQLPAYTFIDVLDLSFNKLGGSVSFPSAGGYLYYSNNKFSSIPSLDFIRQFRTFTTIKLANNELRGPIPYIECQQNDNIKILDLSGNHFSGPVPPHLLKGCSNLLLMLNLGANNLSGQLPDEMGESCSLRVIHLHGNQIQGRLPRSLASCKSLLHLDVGRNKFVDVFPSWLGNLPYLSLLVLRSNQFYGPLTMPSGNKENSYFFSLRFIDLAGNCFNGALPSEFFNLLKSMMRPQMNLDNFEIFPVPVQVAMKQLYLCVNKITYYLVVIDLSNNRFSGSIPKTIGNLVALYVLNLSRNALSGNIPAEFGRLSNVESLDLSWNHLTGSVPPAMASLTNLEVLNLSYNDLSGRIPSGGQFSTFTSSSYQGGNQGLYGCPLPVRCNLTQPPSGASGPAPPASVTATNHSFEAIILWLFVGSGYGVGIVVSIMLQMMTCCGRHMNKALENMASCIA